MWPKILIRRRCTAGPSRASTFRRQKRRQRRRRRRRDRLKSNRLVQRSQKHLDQVIRNFFKIFGEQLVEGLTTDPEARDRTLLVGIQAFFLIFPIKTVLKIWCWSKPCHLIAGKNYLLWKWLFCLFTANKHIRWKDSFIWKRLDGAGIEPRPPPRIINVVLLLK